MSSKFALWLLTVAMAWAWPALSGAQSMKPGSTFRDCADCPEMVVIPAGRSVMGSTAAERRLAAGRGLALKNMSDEGPHHWVRIARPFAAGKYEVTRAQYAAFAAASGHASTGKCWYWDTKAGEVKQDERHTWQSPGFAQSGEHPVVCVAWHDAVAYARWLAQKTGKPYRLLSETEWEYAARAGTRTSRYWGDNPDDGCAFANVADLSTRVLSKEWRVHRCRDGHVHTAPIGRFRPNRFGLHDMLGNVWEWTRDCGAENYLGKPRNGAPYIAAGCTSRVARGGGWYSSPPGARSAYRIGVHPTLRNTFLGFRVARTLP